MRVYTSCLCMRFSHCVAFFKYLCWLISMSFLMSMERNIISSKTQCNAENARVNGMWQFGFSDFETLSNASTTTTKWTRASSWCCNYDARFRKHEQKERIKKS